MIYHTKNVDLVRPLFERYIRNMKKYFEVKDEKEWLRGANEYLSLYGSELEREIYLVSVSKEDISGFALVNQGYRFNCTGRVISQFYISDEKQGRGNGRDLAEYVFAKHPGA